MKFSVTIPAYKAKFLKECIESVLAQTYKDFELIIVNDASPEDLTSIVQSFDDPRIRYYINETNCGALNVVDNWNKCLSYATGEYIICMGDDDKLKPNCLQIYNALIEKYPDLDVYHGWTEIINEKSETIDIQSPRPEYEGVYSLIWNRWTCRKRQFIGDFLFRTNALKANGGYYKLPLAWSSDDISAVIMAKKGIANTQDLCFEYRVNSQTISSTGNVEIKVESIVKERRWYKKFIENDFTLSEVEAIYLNLIKKWIDKHFDKKIGLYIGLGMIKNPIIIFSIWKKRKYYKLNNFVFKYALLVFIKTQQR